MSTHAHVGNGLDHQILHYLPPMPWAREASHGAHLSYDMLIFLICSQVNVHCPKILDPLWASRNSTGRIHGGTNRCCRIIVPSRMWLQIYDRHREMEYLGFGNFLVPQKTLQQFVLQKLITKNLQVQNCCLEINGLTIQFIVSTCTHVSTCEKKRRRRPNPNYWSGLQYTKSIGFPRRGQSQKTRLDYSCLTCWPFRHRSYPSASKRRYACNCGDWSEWEQNRLKDGTSVQRVHGERRAGCRIRSDLRRAFEARRSRRNAAMGWHGEDGATQRISPIRSGMALHPHW